MLRPFPLSPGGNYSDPPLILPHDDSLLSGVSGSTLNEGQAIRNTTQHYDSSGLRHGTTQNADATGSANNMRGVTQKQDATITPRVGNTRRSTCDQQNYATENATVNLEVRNHLSTPSWDIDNTFSFCKKNTKNKQERHLSQRSQSSIPVWDILSAIGISRSESTVIDESAKIQCDDRDEPNERMQEETENDLFAMQVGLM